MKMLFINCFCIGDEAREPLTKNLENAKADDSTLELVEKPASNISELKRVLLEQIDKKYDILIIGGHGHNSLSGFNVCNEPLSWHDPALLLRGKLSIKCTFIFYSCNGGFPGMCHLFGKESGPNFIFGPTIKVDASIMANAIIEIINLKKSGTLDLSAAKQLVESSNKNNGEFLRVWWSEVSRYPKSPSKDIPEGDIIPVIGWGLYDY